VQVASFRLLYTAPPRPPPPPVPVAPVLALPSWAVGALIGGGSVVLFAAFVGMYAMLGGRVAPSLSPLPKGEGPDPNRDNPRQPSP
jgi:hypothetical protein